MGIRLFTLIAAAQLCAAPVQAFGETPSAPELLAELASGELTSGVHLPGGPAPSVEQPAAPGDWIVEEADNVCGLKDGRQIRHPAVVDYDALIEVTVEVKEMKRKGIDKDSPEGQVIYTRAVDRVRTAASDHMKDKSYDSIWKQIKHRRGLKAPDATDAIKKLVEKGSKGAAPRR